SILLTGKPAAGAGDLSVAASAAPGKELPSRVTRSAARHPFGSGERIVHTISTCGMRCRMLPFVTLQSVINGGDRGELGQGGGGQGAEPVRHGTTARLDPSDRWRP